MTKEELLTLAEQRGVRDVDRSMSKREIVREIRRPR